MAKAAKVKKSKVGNPEMLAWVKKTLLDQQKLRMAGAVGCGIAGCIVLWITWWVWYTLIVFWMIRFGGGSAWMAIFSAWIALGLTIVAHFFVNRAHLEKLEFESVERLQAHRLIARAIGSPWMAIAGPKSAISLVKVICSTFLLGPGILATGWNLWQQVLSIKKADFEAIARVFQAIADAGGRVEFDLLMLANRDIDQEQWVPQLRLVDGIVFLTSEPPGITVTDSLLCRLTRF